MLNLNDGVEETPQPAQMQEKIRKKVGTVPKIVFGAVLLLVMPMLGNTFAGTITITNTGGKVEFGQGIAATVACDTDGVSITPTASYDSNTTAFVVQSLSITGLDRQSSACANKLIRLYIVDTASALGNYAGTSASSRNVIGIQVGTSGAMALDTVTVTGQTTNTTISSSTGSTANESVTVTVAVPFYSASLVTKVIIQTS